MKKLAGIAALLVLVGSQLDAAIVRTTTRTTPAGTQNTVCPLGDCAPNVLSLDWDEVCLTTALAGISNQFTGVATSIDVRVCLDGTDAASATITETETDWSIVGGDDLTHAGVAVGSGTLQLTATFGGDVELSATFPWAYQVDPGVGDNRAPNPVTGTVVTAVGTNSVTVEWDSVADVDDASDASGVDHYNIKLNGTTVDTLAAANPGLLNDFTATNIGTGTGTHTCTQSGAQWTLVGGGAGLEGVADQVLFCSMTVSGSSVDIIAEVLSLTTPATYNKAFIELRASTAVGSVAFGCALQQVASQLYLSSRNRFTTGGARSSSSTTSLTSVPKFIWLHYDANGGDCSTSDGGGEWTNAVSNVQVVLPDSKVAGFGVTPTSNGATLTAVFPFVSVNNAGRLSKTVTTAVGGTWTVTAVDVEGNETTALPGDSGIPETPSMDGVKWTPGHGAWIGGYISLYDGNSSASMTHFANELAPICANTNIKIIQVMPRWRTLEGNTANDYSGGFAIIDSLAAQVAACNKVLHVHIKEREFGGPPGTPVCNPNCNSLATYEYPLYLMTSAYGPCCAIQQAGYQEYGGVILSPPTETWFAGGLKAVAKVWEPVVMDRLIALHAAYLARYDSDPRVEMFSLGESAIAAVSLNAAGWYTQLKRWHTAAAANGPHTMHRMFLNFSSGAGTMEDLISHCASLNGCVIGGPDLECPLPVELIVRSIEANQRFRGNLGSPDRRATMAWVGEQEAFGSSNGCKNGINDTADEIWTYQEETMHARIMIWARSQLDPGGLTIWNSMVTEMGEEPDMYSIDCPANFTNGCE